MKILRLHKDLDDGSRFSKQDLAIESGSQSKGDYVFVEALDTSNPLKTLLHIPKDFVSEAKPGYYFTKSRCERKGYATIEKWSVVMVPSVKLRTCNPLSQPMLLDT